jgi:hypothetical protein
MAGDIWTSIVRIDYTSLFAKNQPLWLVENWYQQHKMSYFVTARLAAFLGIHGLVCLGNEFI